MGNLKATHHPRARDKRTRSYGIFGTGFVSMVSSTHSRSSGRTPPVKKTMGYWGPAGKGYGPPAYRTLETEVCLVSYRRGKRNRTQPHYFTETPQPIPWLFCNFL